MYNPEALVNAETIERTTYSEKVFCVLDCDVFLLRVHIDVAIFGANCALLISSVKFVR